MRSDEQSSQQIYRLVITRRAATEVLLNALGPARQLPSLHVRPAERLAVQLTQGAKDCCDIDTYCLFVPGFSAVPGHWRGAKYAVLESVEQDGNAPAGTEWICVRAALSESTLSAEECDGLRNSMEEMDRNITNPSKRPFARPGWIRELFAWIQDQFEQNEIRTTGQFEQLTAGPSFSLIRFETTGNALWFKATGEPKLHEMPITRTLACLLPSYVPEILGVHPGWNAWLSRECEGATLDTLDAWAWTKTAETLARLEIASLGKCRALLECGCRNLTVAKLFREIDPFLARMSERMALQTKQPPAVLSDSDIALLREALEQACSVLQDLDLPDVLGHIDFNPGNIVVSPDRCKFLDWAEGSLMSPFLTFAYLREYARPSQVFGPGFQSQLAGAYLRPWRPLLSPSDLARGMELSSLVAVYAYALAIDEQRLQPMLESPELAGFLRSLARRMQREACEIMGMSGLCRQ
jgi:phosphotransferase family enzyme